MQVVPPEAVADWFTPEEPGPVIHAHITASGVGRCRVDRWPNPRTVLAELPDNVSCRGEPVAVPDLAGFVQAPPEWLPALRRVDPGTTIWPRVIAQLPAEVEVPAPSSDLELRRLGSTDAAAVAELDPAIAWIGKSWGGPAGLAASGLAWAAFDDGRIVSVACPFFVGTRYEDIGVVTDPRFRRRGLSTSCAAALVADIRARGRVPTWTTSPDNVGSLGVAAALGFRRVREDVLYAVRTPIPTAT